MEHAGTRYLPVWRSRSFVTEGPVESWLASHEAESLVAAGHQTVFLGLQDDTALVAIDISGIETPHEQEPFAGRGEFKDLREIGPLMAAIMLTARSGSAFAAEIGTMKVNEEVDALTTMGLEPVRFLVVPRVIAAFLVVPVLTIVMTAAGLVGGAVVFLSLDFPLVTYVNRILEAVSLTDFGSGIFKGFVFGVVVAAVGCLRGIQTGKGASAVGESTTSSVVSGIILIAVLDGIFAVIFFMMGI